MKKEVVLVLLLILVASCSDIINSDDNINKTKNEKFKGVKSDQTKDVLISLEVGNYWIYKVRVYDTSGFELNTGLDTLKVDSVFTIENQKWFLLRHYMGQENVYSQEPFIITNTDLGLWCLLGSFEGLTNYLLAKYPVKNDEVFSSDQIIRAAYKVDDKGLANDIQATRNVKVKFPITNVLESGVFDCYNYSDSYDKFINSPSDNFEILEVVNNYALNKGMVKSSYYRSVYINNLLSYKNLIWLWELVGFNVRSIKIKQNIYEYDFGTMPESASNGMKYDDVLYNNSNEDVKVFSVNFFANNCELQFDIFPTTIYSKTNWGLKIEARTKKTGKFDAKVIIYTSAGEYIINVNGTCE